MYLKLKKNKLIQFLCVVLVLTQLINNSILKLYIPIPTFVYSVVVLLVMLSFLFVIFPTFRANEWLVLVCICFFISLLFNIQTIEIGSIFRFISWIILITALGPLLYNERIVDIRNKLFILFLTGFVIVGNLSFVYWVLGLPQLGRGHFSGVLNHSMLLAPVCGIGAAYCFYKYVRSATAKGKLFFLLSFLFNVSCMLLASSRVSFLATVLALTPLLLLLKYPFKKIIISSVALSSISFFVITDFNDMYIENAETTIAGNLINRGAHSSNTREILWNDRLNEFKNSPFVGVGFANQDADIVEKDGVEPGSSYLGVLSMTGFLGALSLLIFFILPLRAKVNNLNEFEILKCSIYCFFLIHFIAEGYILASGALLCSFFWCLVGSSAAYTFKNKNLSFK